jgi:hypothetical protein
VTGAVTVDVVSTLAFKTAKEDEEPAIDVVTVGWSIDEDVVTGCEDDDEDIKDGDKSGFKYKSTFTSINFGEETSVFSSDDNSFGALPRS